MSFFNKLFGKKSDQGRPSAIDYNKYFDTVEINGTPLELLSLGEIFLSSGEIIICDPLTGSFHAKPLTKKVKSGRYPVTICVAQTEDSGDRYAIAKLEFSTAKANRWELAVNDSQDINTLKNDDEFFGFPVDTGLGCFMDNETKRYYNDFNEKFIEIHPGDNIYDDLLAAEFKKNAKNQNDPHDAGDWLNFFLPNKADLNIIMFNSGFGDGVYPAYWGIAEKGEICSLVIVFMVLE